MAPGVYFRLLLVGYFEGIDSERGISWRAGDSLSIREFVGIPIDEGAPDHTTISRTRRLIDVETHRQVFGWILELLADVPISSYRFHAEVRHDQAFRISEVGIFMLASQHAAPEGTYQFACSLAYNDHERLFHVAPNKMSSQVAVELRRWKGFQAGRRPLEIHYYEPPEVRSRRPPQWRQLAVVVTPQSMRAYWQGH